MWPWIPAYAGMTSKRLAVRLVTTTGDYWMPAFAGMTKSEVLRADSPNGVIPANAGIQGRQARRTWLLDTGLRRYDEQAVGMAPNHDGR